VRRAQVAARNLQFGGVGHRSLAACAQRGNGPTPSSVPSPL
jgi:hypothetical protein